MITRRAMAGAAAAFAAARPARAQGRSRVLRFVPQSDLLGLDPVWTTGFVVRNAAYMTYDTLYATDSVFRVRPQMAEGHERSDDGLQWTVRLRPGLRFHDGEPVRAADCVASIRRWAQRDLLGQVLMARTDELAALDDRSFRFRLRAPFPLLIEALGKFSSPVLFIMPERMARLPATQAVTEHVGSGPFRFRADEMVQGSHFAWERFNGYIPRDEPPDNTAGGKAVHVPGVEWTVIPDAQTAMSALVTGQVDWIEQPSADLLPLAERAGTVTVRALDPLGSYVLMRFNCLYPPFDDARVRRAVLLAASQDEFMQAMGGDPALSRPCRAFFPCGTPLAKEEGPEAMPGDLAAARALVKESGHDGRSILVLAAADKAYLFGLASVAAELLNRIGLKAELVSTDWASILARRASQKPPAEGGWNVFFTTGVAPEFADPASNYLLSANGRAGWPGWFNDPAMEQMRRDWLLEPDPARRAALALQMQAEAFQQVPFVPLGQYRLATAYQKTITGLVPSSVPMFWGLRPG